MATVKLEADPSILERKLLLDEFKVEDELVSLFPSKEKSQDETIPWKLVLPSPGFCVKFLTPDGDKVFLNICHTNEVPPPPKDITESQLVEILESEGGKCYTVPMSIGDLHMETDKSGNLCSVYDIALSSAFYDKCKKSDLFMNFLMMVAASGIEEKFKIDLNMQSEKPFIILKNRKVLGTLQSHRIQQRPVKTPPKPLIEELSVQQKPVQKPQKALIEEIPNRNDKCDNQLPNRSKNLKIELYPNCDKPEKVIATVREVKALSGKNLQLDVGEDRIVLVNLEKEQLLIDVFLPVNVDPDKAEANFHTTAQVLEIHMPLTSDRV